ncbi:g-D-glutamyl-meso-diaminopimelate peptidase [Gracilibacillus ureilyticus]|uniref:G-D-glutamyl-meso-diaminopimelate peptidase n=1 Tax=Gracilibacillus ureilyticus TaxID=531814 RepID=A0A1H9S259_9BACI|nr:M14 family metallocarboxypeptidase [Gracilibacillus ureilyticus]SER79110.1 g-D-glutamyl-meso-diaminopimelate peptidase [Gracilibacillus ureilyticus]
MGDIVNPKQVYRYKQLVKDSELLTRRYECLKKAVIGYSVQGRELIALKLGSGKRKIMLNGAHHAREWLTTALLMNMVEDYCERYENEKNVKILLQDVSIWFVPMVNPDGVTLVQDGVEQFEESDLLIQMNNGSEVFDGWKANIRGVDLNRQYPIDWENIDDQIQKPAPAMFKGPKPLSEPEAKSLYDFALKHKFSFVACYHSSGEEIFWQYKLSGKEYVYAKGFADQLSTITGYRLVDPGPDPSGGGFTDWFIMVQKRPAFTIEIAPYVGPVPVPLKHYNKIWTENKEVGMILARACLYN